MSQPINIVTLKQVNPDLLYKFLRDNPQLAVMQNPDIYAFDSDRQNAVSANAILKDGPVFVKYMSLNEQMESFRNGKIKLKDLDVKLLTNDTYFQIVLDIVQDRLYERFQNKLNLANNDDEKAEIIDSLDNKIVKIVEELDKTRTNYLE